jgi:hypothetical protein
MLTNLQGLPADDRKVTRNHLIFEGEIENLMESPKFEVLQIPSKALWETSMPARLKPSKRPSLSTKIHTVPQSSGDSFPPNLPIPAWQQPAQDFLSLSPVQAGTDEDTVANAYSNSNDGEPDCNWSLIATYAKFRVYRNYRLSCT